MANEVRVETKALSAVTLGRDLFIAETTPKDYLNKVLHEGGHVIAWEISFNSGQVLTPSQTRASTVSLTAAERIWLTSDSFHRTTPVMTNQEVAKTTAIAAMLIAELTQGNFDPSNLTVNYGVDIARLFEDRAVVEVNVKKQRRVEIPAYYIQLGGLSVLRGSLLKEAASKFPDPPLPNFLPHRGALRVVYAAFQHNWTVPSMVDRQVAA